MKKKFFAIVAALLTGAIGIATTFAPQAAEAGIKYN
jgi:hypothetical protein